MKATYSTHLRTALASLSLGALFLTGPSLASADNTPATGSIGGDAMIGEGDGKDAKDTKSVPEVTPPAPDQWWHVLINPDISNHYITPRGLDNISRGVINQDLLLLFLDVYHDKNPSAFLNDVTITLGTITWFNTAPAGVTPGHWNEIDPIAGIAFTFLNDWKFEFNYTTFFSETGSYKAPTSLQWKLSFDDSKYLGAFALHPWVYFWDVLDNAVTVLGDRGSYFDIGITPTVQIAPWLKFEAPLFIELTTGKNFYGSDNNDAQSGLALFQAEGKFTIPLTFIPKDLGSWSFYAGVKYYRFNNNGLEQGNLILDGAGKKDLVQFHGGLTIFF